ncbi:MAG: HalOD1 output domain-containing protein [Haloarculaceae archaeon]
MSDGRHTTERRFQHDWDGDAELTTEILDAVASVDDADVYGGQRLYDAVDPDALETLFEPVADASRSTGRLSFTVAECRVTVDADGDVRVTGPNRRRWQQRERP